MTTSTMDVVARATALNANELVDVLASELDQDERLYMILRYAEELDIHEIAIAMGCDEASVQSGLNRIQTRITELASITCA